MDRKELVPDGVCAVLAGGGGLGRSPSGPCIVDSSYRAASSQPGRTNVSEDCATHSEERPYLRGDFVGVFYTFRQSWGRSGEFFSFMFIF